LKNSSYQSIKKLLLFLFSIQLIVSSIPAISIQGENLLNENDVFRIPEKNCSIHFSSEGSFNSAILKNGYWIFEKIELFNSPNPDKLFLKVSGQNCDILINSYFVYNRTYDGEKLKRAVLRYTTSGSGTQTFNLGLDPKMGAFDARLNREWVGKNNGWTVDSDGTYEITKATENVSLLYYGYPESFSNNQELFNNHYILFISSVFIAITVSLSIIFRKKRKKLQDNKRVI
jgi:hypothetical protein